MSSDRSSLLTRAAVTTGATLTGAYVGTTAARWWHRRSLPPPDALPPVLDWASRSLETPHGRSHCYVRPGTGPPIVLLHSLNAVASSHEMVPIAEHLAATTDRPLYAVDWLGFGRSDRPALDYTPQVYGDQLYQVLSDLLDAPADLVALSLGCEYAAWMGLQAAPLVRRLALISPTGLTAARGPSLAGRLALALAAPTGLFELFYYRLTRPASLRDYYERQVFLDAEHVSDVLVDAAATTAQAKGASYAPQRFVQGRLYVPDAASSLYERLYRPTLFLTPSRPGPTVQSFDLLSPVLDRNPRSLTHRTLPGGLMPHWEASAALFDVLTPFLSSPEQRAGAGRTAPGA
ncbi:MAG: alpha/beta fold hydrolase [Salinibacter sp.]